MSALSEEALKQHVKVYVRVFLALGVLTVLTVGVSYLKLPLALAIAVALAIAILKGSLVAGFFMHLVSEKKIIFWILLFAFLFFIVLLLSPAYHSF